MKKHLFVITILFFFLFYLPLNTYIIDIYLSLLRIIIPSIILSIFFSAFIINSSLLESIYQIYQNTLLGRFIFTLIIYLICLLGIPSNIIVINHLYQKNIIKEKEELIYHVPYLSYAFFINIIFNNIENKYTYLIIYLLGTFILFIYSFKYNYQTKIKDIEEDIDINKIISSSFFSLGKIIFSVLIFSIFNFFISLIPYENKFYIYPLFEFSYGIIEGIKHQNKYLMFNLFFPSLSILFQLNLFSDIQIFKYIKRRFFIALFFVIFTFFLE